MRIAVVCRDTRGGVQPYAALAQGLKAAGHDVWATAPSNLAHLFAEVGVEARALSDGDDIALIAQSGVAEMSGAARRAFMREGLPRQLGAWTRETLEACAGADLVTGGIGGMAVGLSVAEKLRLPFVETQLQPVNAPTGRYPGVLAARLPGWTGRLGRRLSHDFSDMALWMMFGSAMRTARAEALGLTGPVRPNARRPRIYGFSSRVVPLPEDPLRTVAGYWTLPPAPGWAPPPHLERFLAAPGPPVVAIGFGSMASRDPAALTAIVVGAAKDAGVRAVLLGGWGGLTAVDDPGVTFLDDAPHEWLLPLMAAVVHHGGAGTTGAALRAGVPSILVPFAVDQPFWASRVEALGVGPRAVPRRGLTREALARALTSAVGDHAMQARAAALGEALRTERGVALAVAALERHRRMPPAA